MWTKTAQQDKNNGLCRIIDEYGQRHKKIMKKNVFIFFDHQLCTVKGIKVA